MPTIAIRLDPRHLANPDLDIRYVLPDLLEARSGGVISDDGYDYVGDVPYLVLFLQTQDVAGALRVIDSVIKKEEILGNRLAEGVVVGWKDEGRYTITYPADFAGEFPTNEDSA